MIDLFLQWGVFLPAISGDQDNGLYDIERIAWLVYQNPAGQEFVQGTDPVTGDPLEVGAKFMKDFTVQRGEFMWSQGSTDLIEQWVTDPRIEIEDYTRTEASEYSSFNDFFARDITVDEANYAIASKASSVGGTLTLWEPVIHFSSVHFKLGVFILADFRYDARGFAFNNLDSFGNRPGCSEIPNL